uniref:Disease resistance N-terminal domain-containing protein n=1 Tax=Salix viminalis TaxID=40686 RepID=A0A6N2MRG1_SALVM
MFGTNSCQNLSIFQSEFYDTKTQLDLMKSFLADAYRLKRKEETVETTLSIQRELVYVTEDCCGTFTPRELIFQYRTGKKLKDISERIKKMHKILKAYFKTIGQHSIHDDCGSIGKRWTSPCLR